jgi:hypothetical protein
LRCSKKRLQWVAALLYFGHVAAQQIGSTESMQFAGAASGVFQPVL